MSVSELWRDVGMPEVKSGSLAQLFWNAKPPDRVYCPGLIWDEERGAKGPWCGGGKCRHKYPLKPKLVKERVRKRSYAELERENSTLRRRLNLLLAADALADTKQPFQTNA